MQALAKRARSLAEGKSHSIGLLVHSLTVEYFGEIARGVDDELAPVQYDLMLYTTHRRKGRELAYVTRLTCVSPWPRWGGRLFNCSLPISRSLTRRFSGSNYRRN